MHLMLSPDQHDSLLIAALHTRRSDIAVLKASGPDLRKYLQSQVTQDMGLLSTQQAIYAMALTPQGKAVADLIIAEGDNDELILLTWRNHAEILVERLRRFSLGYTLRIGTVDDMGVHSIQGAHAASMLNSVSLPNPGSGYLSTAYSDDGILVLTMPEAADCGYWLIAADVLLNELNLDADKAADEAAIRSARIRQGHPVFGLDWDASLHPMNANLLEYNGVSFDKGCYVGQEVTSRMRWRGGIKYRLYRLALSSLPSTLPTPMHSTAAIGSVTSVMQDSDMAIYGIGRLPISVADSGVPLHVEDGIDVRIIEACHA